MNAWILVANSSEAYLYGSSNIRIKDIYLIKEIVHPESREKESNQVTDRPGQYQGQGTTRGNYEKKIGPKEVAAEHFAKELATKLKLGFDVHNYDQLILISSPRFYGLLKGYMNFTPPEIIHIPKDYTKLKQKELLEKLREHLYG